MKEVLVIDTSVLCVWLKVPGKLDCGSKSSDETNWNFERAVNEFDEDLATEMGLLYVVPVATLIETGNHIAQSKGRGRENAVMGFQKLLKDLAKANAPWAPFANQQELWTQTQLQQLAERWPDLAKRGVGVGDATILDVVAYYSRKCCDVKLLTGDSELYRQSFEYKSSPRSSRRSRRRRR
jgi:hypothetical protein